MYIDCTRSVWTGANITAIQELTGSQESKPQTQKSMWNCVEAWHFEPFFKISFFKPKHRSSYFLLASSTLRLVLARWRNLTEKLKWLDSGMIPLRCIKFHAFLCSGCGHIYNETGWCRPSWMSHPVQVHFIYQFTYLPYFTFSYSELGENLFNWKITFTFTFTFV